MVIVADPVAIGGSCPERGASSPRPGLSTEQGTCELWPRTTRYVYIRLKGYWHQCPRIKESAAGCVPGQENRTVNCQRLVWRYVCPNETVCKSFCMTSCGQLSQSPRLCGAQELGSPFENLRVTCRPTAQRRTVVSVGSRGEPFVSKEHRRGDPRLRHASGRTEKTVAVQHRSGLDGRERRAAFRPSFLHRLPRASGTDWCRW